MRFHLWPEARYAAGMCTLYTLRLSAWEVRNLMQHYKLVGREWEDVVGSRNDALEVYPNRTGPVVVVQDGQRIVRQDMLWGFPPTRGGRHIVNFRNLELRMWRDWLDRERRCVVPATAFSEPDRNTSKPVQWRWFRRPDGQPFFFAGIWRPWTGDRGTRKAPNVKDHILYSIMTTEPNGIVRPIHDDAMPVMLMTPEDVDRWLNSGSVEDARAMQKPAPDDAVVVLPAGEKAA